MISVMKDSLKVQNEKLSIAATQLKDDCAVYGRHVADKMRQMDREARLALVEKVDSVANRLLRETFARENNKLRYQQINISLNGQQGQRPSDFNIPPRNFDMYTTPQMYQQMAQPMAQQIAQPMAPQRPGSYRLPYVNGQLFQQQRQPRPGQPRPILGIVPTPLCVPLIEENEKDIMNFDLNVSPETNTKTSAITFENVNQEKTPPTPKMPKK